MTTATASSELEPATPKAMVSPGDSVWRQMMRSRRVLVGGGVLSAIVLACLLTLPWTATRYTDIDGDLARSSPGLSQPDLARAKETKRTRENRFDGLFGYDRLGRSLLVRCLMGGTISLAVGLAAATIAVVLGVSVGLLAGYKGGWVDSLLMRTVDVLYGLPYVLLVILFKVAFEPKMIDTLGMDPQTASVVVLFSAIGLVSWLTMARVVRGQVLSLRGQPFVEACRALGMKERRIFLRHILPNLVGPITVYATLTVPSAILQESFLSFLGVGINAPLPTWGNLASEALDQLYPRFYWWTLIFPCALLAVTLLSLNFVGDGLRDVFDPKKEAAKI